MPVRSSSIPARYARVGGKSVKFEGKKKENLDQNLMEKKQENLDLIFRTFAG